MRINDRNVKSKLLVHKILTSERAKVSLKANLVFFLDFGKIENNGDIFLVVMLKCVSTRSPSTTHKYINQ